MHNESLRSVSRVIKSTRTVEGGGFLVHRAFPTKELMDLDPFLLLDEMGPVDYAPGEAVGAPDHPHKGFETVTYMLEGRFEHRDSHGHSGKLNPGDVQWMTAGGGIVHSEMPEKEFVRSGGKMHAFQLWVNLPKHDKEIKPHYQEIPSSKIPSAKTEDGKVGVSVIAGESLGIHAAIDTRTPIMYLHFVIQPTGEIKQPVPSSYNAFAYVVDGEGFFGEEEDRPVQRGHMVVFGNDGNSVLVRNASKNGLPLDVLLIAGAPLGEPVARYGPFVMNTEEEIHQAVEDYRSGMMGEIKS